MNIIRIIYNSLEVAIDKNRQNEQRKQLKNADKSFVSSISQHEFPESEKVHAKIIRKSIFDLIQKNHKEFNRNSLMSISELNRYREKYIAQYLMNEVGELSTLEEDVLKTLQNHEILSKNMAKDSEAANFTFG